MGKLGYTFYPKDWNNSEQVFQLNLEERGLYRELIDLAMLNDNNTEVKLKVWSRKFDCNTETLNTILITLAELDLIEINDKKILFIPSCENMLILSRAGRKGGKKTQENKPTPKPTVKPTPKPIAKQREKKLKEKKVIGVDVVKKFLDWFNNQKLKHTGKVGSFKSLSKTDINNLNQLTEDYDPKDFNDAIPSLFASVWAKETNNQTPTHFLRVDNFNKFLNQDSTIAPPPKTESLYD